MLSSQCAPSIGGGDVLRNEVGARGAPGERLNLLGPPGVGLRHAGLRWAHMYTLHAFFD